MSVAKYEQLVEVFPDNKPSKYQALPTHRYGGPLCIRASKGREKFYFEVDFDKGGGYIRIWSAFAGAPNNFIKRINIQEEAILMKLAGEK